MIRKSDEIFAILEMVLNALGAGNSLPPDIDLITLAESDSGLGIKLTPVQYLLLKLIGSSRADGEFTETDPDHISTLKNLLGYTQTEKRLWLPGDSKIDVNESRVTISFESPITLFYAVAGRRSGKTTISSILSSWLARRVILDRSFLEGSAILPGTSISLLNVAPEEDQAKILFRMLVNNLRTLDLIPDKSSPTDTLEIPPVVIESLNSSSRSVRGRTAVCVSIDELAHFHRTSGPNSDRSMWLAVMPSLATLAEKALGVVTTTPAGRSGVAWDIFRQRGEREGMLTAQVPTWVMNPHVTRKSLDGEYKRDDFLARQEYGAEFLAPERQFLRITDIRNCIRKESVKPSKNVRRHLHIDLGLIHDATAMALGYIEKSDDSSGEKLVVIERVEVLKGSPENPLNVNDIEKRILKIAEDYNLSGVTFDQHQSAMLVDRLKAAGIPARVFPATAKSNRETYAYLRDLITTGRISIPDHDLLITELEHLECTIRHDGFKVEASTGFSDDCADAVACCAWCLANDGEGDWTDMFSIVQQ